MKINWKSYFTGMLTVGTLAFIGGVIDFQNIKASVRKLESRESKTESTVNAIGIIVCTFAIENKMKKAKETCREVLGNN